MNINKIYIDTSKSRTDLCNLGAQYGTDKSPYNTGWFRHPYTAVYDFLFARYRHDKINFGEIGIAANASMKCWRSYFLNANLYGYDFMPDNLNNANAHNLENTQYILMDCRDTQSINDGLSKCADKFDILIDDASHRPEDQFPVIKAAIEHLKPGGMLIIEDIFRSSVEGGTHNAIAQSHGVTGENQYESIIEQYSKYFHHISWVVTNHEARHTPEWENDAWLVMVRNTVEYQE
jgi:SAM-dependent methyltransferase